MLYCNEEAVVVKNCTNFYYSAWQKFKEHYHSWCHSKRLMAVFKTQIELMRVTLQTNFFDKVRLTRAENIDTIVVVQLSPPWSNMVQCVVTWCDQKAIWVINSSHHCYTTVYCQTLTLKMIHKMTKEEKLTLHPSCASLKRRKNSYPITYHPVPLWKRKISHPIPYPLEPLWKRKYHSTVYNN